MGKIVEVKNFELHKMKLKGLKGIEVMFFDKSEPNSLWSVDSDGTPHEDLVKSLNKLKEVFAYSLQLNNGWDFAREHNRKNAELLAKAKKFWDDEVEKCEVKGVTLVGSGEKQGIKIAGSLKTDLGVVGLASPIVRFDAFITNSIDEDVMIGDLAECAFKEVQEEVWKFIFKQKRGGELFPAEEDETPKSGLNITMQKVG